MIETHSSAKFAQFISEFKRNGSVDESLTKVYGVDQDGLTREWRKSAGLPETQKAPDSPQSGGSSRAAGGGDEAPVALIAGAAVLLVLLAVAAGVGGLLLARRSRPGGIE